MEMTNSQMRFKEPQVLSEEIVDGKVVKHMAFNTLKEANDWMFDQRTKGVDVQSISKGKKTNYHVGPVHKHIKLGGTEEGMRAIGYIAQTFLAHSFPNIARLPELQRIKDYTLNKIGTDFVWWDFDPPTDLPANRFEFGHRVIVGLNKDNGTAYAYISLFSTLHFAILFGEVPVEASQTVITDIDPLAKSPPKDIHNWTENAAKGAVSRPANLIASLTNAISSGKVQTNLQKLIERMKEFERRTAAGKILSKFTDAAILSHTDRNKLFSDVASSESQRILQLVQTTARNYKLRASNAFEHGFVGFLEKSTELDPTSTNGLTAKTTQYLAIACDALAKQMIKDFESGILYQERVEMLIGGEIGMYTVATALCQNFVMNFQDRDFQ